MKLCRDHPLATALVALLLLCLPGISAAQTDQIVQRFQERGRELLDKPYYKAPFSCDDSGWASGRDNYVVDVAPWVQAAGLRRGDRLMSFDGLSLANATYASEVWAQVPHGAFVDIRVERSGKEVIVKLPCRDNSAAWQLFISTLRAIVEGRWQDCLDDLRRTTQLRGITSAGQLSTGVVCMRGKLAAAPRPAPQSLQDDYWRLLHAWATKTIEQSRYRPVGLADDRAGLLNATEALEKAGRKTLADNIKQQIAKFEQAPSRPSTVEPTLSQRVGTAFAVRPDGVLLTAFHIVKDASEIEVSCAEVPKASALIAQFSESNDLAVLRLTEAKTPTYLSLAEQRSVSIGDQVFTIGYPAPSLLGGEAKFTEGAISSLSVGGDAGYMQISVPVQPGNSGGALVNRSGEVVGVVVATASALTFLKGTGSLPQNVSWAVKGGFAAPLYDQPPRSPKLVDRGAIIRRVVNATCSIRVSVQADQ